MASNQPSEQPQPLSAIGLIRAWVRQEVATRTELDYLELRAGTLSHFTSPTIREAAFNELISQVVAEVLRHSVSYQRRWLRTRSGLISKQDIDRRAQTLMSRWLINTGPGHYLSLGDAVRPLLLADADEREVRAAGELRAAAFERDVAGHLPDDVTPVKIALTDDTLGEIWNLHYGPINEEGDVNGND